MIRVVGKRGKGSVESQLDEAAKGAEFVRIDCTSGNPDMVMREGLSPFFLGPVECFNGIVAKKFENAWQFSKVVAKWGDFKKCKGEADHPVYAPLRKLPFVGADGEPNADYFKWRDTGFADEEAHRFPLGGAGKRWRYSYWKVSGEYRHLGYVESRKAIYIPLYARAVVKTEAYRRLCAMRDAGKNLLLMDFDGYNMQGEPFASHGFTYNDVIHCPLFKMGHGFVLAMLLEGLIHVDDAGIVKYADGLMDDPHKSYGKDLRKMTDAQKLERASSCAGVSVEELQTLSDADRKMLKRAYVKEVCAERKKAIGISRAGWKRLPLEEKLRIARSENLTSEVASIRKGRDRTQKAAVRAKCNTCSEVDATKIAPLPRPLDLTGYFDAGTLADATGTVSGWAAADRSDIVRLWVPKTIVSIGNFAFKGCANLEEVVFEASPDGADQTVGTMAFAGCPKLGKVLLSAAVRSIGSGAFRDDGTLATFQIDPTRNLVQVGPHAFDNCPDKEGLQLLIASAKADFGCRPAKSENVSAREEFDRFWAEFTDWWGVSEGEEVLTLKRGRTKYSLKCSWDEGTLVLAMIAPWPKEWDYVQLYRGMFGWGDVGDGFHDGKLRKKVANLLLDELIRRNKWMDANREAALRRDQELKDASGVEGENGETPPKWFAEYRWIRNRMATIGEGEMRLYVKGDDHIWGAPVQCEWAISDMRNS